MASCLTLWKVYTTSGLDCPSLAGERGAGVVVEALSVWGCLWKVLLVEPQGGDPGKLAFSEISRTGERGP